METSGGRVAPARLASSRRTGEGAVALDQRRPVRELLEDLPRSAGLDHSTHLAGLGSELGDRGADRVGRAVPREPAAPARLDHLAEPADGGREHRPVVHERLAGRVRPALPQGRDHHDVGVADVGAHLTARHRAAEVDALVLGCHELELLLHRGAQGRRIGVRRRGASGCTSGLARPVTARSRFCTPLRRSRRPR